MAGLTRALLRQGTTAEVKGDDGRNVTCDAPLNVGRGALMTGVAPHHNVIHKMFAKEQDTGAHQFPAKPGSRSRHSMK
jgi:hypothetical protein